MGELPAIHPFTFLSFISFLLRLLFLCMQPAVASSMVGVRFGLYQHIDASKKVFDLKLEPEDMEEISAVVKQGKNLLDVIGDCGDEYR